MTAGLTEVGRWTRTGYLETLTTQRGEGHLVVRRPGALRVDVLAPPPRTLPPAPHSGHPEPDDVGWSLPGPDGHDVPGPLSAATLLLGGAPGAALQRMIAPAGDALARAARLPTPDRPAPSGLRRLRRWLDGATTSPESARLHALVADAGLPGRLARWADDLLDAPRGYALGAPGLNALYPDPAGTRTVVLVTDEVAAAPPAWDLGWLLGELLELTNDPELVPDPVPHDAHPIARAVLERYAAVAPLPARRDVARAALLRWVVHQHDFAAYVGWDDRTAGRVRRIAELAEDA